MLSSSKIEEVSQNSFVLNLSFSNDNYNYNYNCNHATLHNTTLH